VVHHPKTDLHILYALKGGVYAFQHGPSSFSVLSSMTARAGNAAGARPRC
jgi:hypothetical protein